MFNKKVPFLYVLLSAIIGCAITFFAVRYFNKNEITDNDTRVAAGNDSACDYKVQHYVSEFKYISPIISVEPVNESQHYARLKEDIEKYIAKEKQGGLLTATSVYVREFSKGDWFAINARERYDPGSLVKVGVLITYFKMAERDKKLFEMEVVYHGQKGFVFPIEHFRADTVVEGQKYKIKDLIDYMIRYSDNRATAFLEDHMDTIAFKKEFTDLGISQPRFDFPSYMLSVKEYSMLLKALYSAGYLRKTASNNALALLTQSAFKEGLLRELPASVLMAHKFGESGDDVTHELHEAGIVYLLNKPYLITVMTKGKDWNKLSQVLGHISKIVYDNMVANPM